MRQRQENHVGVGQCRRIGVDEGDVRERAQMGVHGADPLAHLAVRGGHGQVQVRVGGDQAQQLAAGVPAGSGHGYPIPHVDDYARHCNKIRTSADLGASAEVEMRPQAAFSTRCDGETRPFEGPAGSGVARRGLGRHPVQTRGHRPIEDRGNNGRCHPTPAYATSEPHPDLASAVCVPAPQPDLAADGAVDEDGPHRLPGFSVAVRAVKLLQPRDPLRRPGRAVGQRWGHLVGRGVGRRHRYQVRENVLVHVDELDPLVRDHRRKLPTPMPTLTGYDGSARRPALIAEIRAALRAAADPALAPGMQAYMKSSMPYLGVRVPAVRALTRAAETAPSPAAGGRTSTATAAALWRAAGHREERYAATALLDTATARRLRDVTVLTVARGDDPHRGVVGPRGRGVAPRR